VVALKPRRSWEASAIQRGNTSVCYEGSAEGGQQPCKLNHLRFVSPF